MDLNKSNLKAKEVETAKIGPSDLKVPEEFPLSLSEAAQKIDPSHFEAFINEFKLVPEADLLRFYYFLEKPFSQVSSLPFFNMLKKSPLSLDPLSYIPKSFYKTAEDWIIKLPFNTLSKFVTWALHRLMAAHARGEEQTYEVGTLVELAMVLRANPDSLTCHLLMLRWRPKYHGEDKLPLIVWMMTQAFQGDLPAGLYSWALNLLPLVANNEEWCYSSLSIDLILQFVEMILTSNPEARAVLVEKPVWRGQRLIPPCSFEMLVRLTFPASVEESTTERFRAIYPLLKEVALAPDDSSSANALKQIFAFSLKLSGGQGSPALANEATAISISVLTQNVDCFKQWDVLYNENLEASVALLENLVDEWDDHYLKLPSSSREILTVRHAMNSFTMKNQKAISEGVANLSLYKEADQSCKLISSILSLGPGIPLFTPMVIASEELSLSVEDDSNWEETEIAPLSKAAEKIDPSHFAAFLDDVLDDYWYHPEWQILKLIDYYGDELSQVSFQWVSLFEEYPLSMLIHVPLSLIPMPVYKKSLDFINKLPFQTLRNVVLWASNLILTEWPGVEQLKSERSKVATFVVLAIVLRTKPDALTLELPELREGPKYQGQDKLPFLIWMMSQASQGGLPAGLYSWVRNLLPLVASNEDGCYSSQLTDLILQSVEMILSSHPEARAVLLNEPVRHGERLIPPCSFEMLVRLTYPPARVEEATERFRAIYPLLKEVALAPDSSTANALEQIFSFSLKLAGSRQGNPALANEATAIAISVLTQNVVCFKQWDVLYNENLEGSVALLEKLVDDLMNYSLKLSSSSREILIVDHSMNSFRMKNQIAFREGVANLSLYKEADHSCKLISRILSGHPMVNIAAAAFT